MSLFSRILHKKRSIDKLSAFTLIELMAAAVIVSVATGGILELSKAHVRSQITTTNKKLEFVSDSIKRSNIARGLESDDLSMLNGHERELFGVAPLNIEYASHSAPGRATVIEMSRDSNIDGTSAMGMKIATSGNAASLPGAVTAPSVNYSGIINPAWFPINDFVSIPTDNPSGTRYYYTTDGSVPTSSSSEWSGATVVAGVSGGLTIPDKFSIKAIHPDPIHGDSAVIHVEFYSAPLVVTMSRESGGGNGVKVTDIENNTNRIVLSHNAHPDFGYIRYNYENRLPTTADIFYNNPFLPTKSQLSSGSAIISARVIVTNPYFSNDSFQTFNLNIEKVKFDDSSIDSPDIINGPTTIQFHLHGNAIGNAMRRSDMNEQPDSSSDSDETMLIQY